MACACKNKRQTFEVIPNAGTAARAAFTSSSVGTAEAVADRYPTSVVRNKEGEAVYFAWPKGSYEVVLQGGDGPVLERVTVRNDADKRPLMADTDARQADGAVVRHQATGTVVYPLTAALTASGSPLTAAAAPTAAHK